MVENKNNEGSKLDFVQRWPRKFEPYEVANAGTLAAPDEYSFVAQRLFACQVFERCAKSLSSVVSLLRGLALVYG